MPNILIVDDHIVITTGLKIVIGSFLPKSVIDVANEGDKAFEKIKHTDYDLIIMDIALPNTDSFNIVSNILAIKPNSRILMFSMSPEETFAKRYLRIGALGYINKDAPLHEIKNAIESALNNKRYLSPELQEKLTLEALSDDPHENQFDKLSPREFEIVQHLVHGDSVSEISRKLNLHTSTIGTHKAKIFEKLKCENIVELVAMAKVHNLIY
ncbi:MAG TPA: response regulator transcription factor [Hanamia sp.]|jgi:two-component system, NarL family, invasion response regulator UvrY|nr:response regulator transcription factor [Hanamia sp.]